MGKFNEKARVKKRTVNKAGGEAFKQTSKDEIVSVLLTSFVENQYYRNSNQTVERIRELVEGIDDKEFIAKAAVFARTEFGMRSVSHVVAAEIARTVKGEEWPKDFFNKVVHRPDDMTEIAAFYLAATGHKIISNQMKKGFSERLRSFDEYRLGKYRGEGNAVSLVDLVNCCRPKPTEALTKLINDELRSTDTWETKLTQAGQNAKDEKEKAKLKQRAWVELITEEKLGYFALLRNLRNIAEQAPIVLDRALRMLVDERAIRKSLVLPFRFVTALEQFTGGNIEGAREITVALNKAVDISLANVPRFEGKTLVALDTSGSMTFGDAKKIGTLFAAVLVKANNADFLEFSTRARYQTLNPSDSTMTIANSINFPGGGTNFHTIFETANRKYDRIIILSDMQAWEEYNVPTAALQAYKKKTGANPKIYSFDLHGYGSTQFPNDSTFCFSGFSEKIFDIMKLLETDRKALTRKIDQVSLR